MARGKSGITSVVIIARLLQQLGYNIEIQRRQVATRQLQQVRSPVRAEYTVNRDGHEKAVPNPKMGIS